MRRNRLLNSILTGIIIMALSGCMNKSEEAKRLIKSAKKNMAYSLNTDAIEDLDKAAVLDPENFEIYYLRGSCYTNMKQFSRAMEDFNRAIELRPDYAKAWANRGYLWSYMDEDDKACADWIEAEDLGMENISDVTRHCRSRLRQQQHQQD